MIAKGFLAKIVGFYFSFTDYFVPKSILAGKGLRKLQRARLVITTGVMIWSISIIILLANIRSSSREIINLGFFNLIGLLLIVGNRWLKIPFSFLTIVGIAVIFGLHLDAIFHFKFFYLSQVIWMHPVIIVTAFLLGLKVGLITAVAYGSVLAFFHYNFIPQFIKLPDFGWSFLEWKRGVLIDQVLSLTFSFVLTSLFVMLKKIADRELANNQKEIHEQQEFLHLEGNQTYLGMASSSIAHEINNPLTIIKNDSHWLKRKIQTGEGKENYARRVGRILNTCTKISKIVNNLYDNSKESSKDPFECVDIKTIVDDVVDIYMHRFSRLGIEFTFESRVDHPIVYGRFIQVYQVLVNLLNNSIDALIEKNPDKKTIKLICEVSEGNLILSVIDSGPGIPKDREDKVFEPFYTTKGETSGTGLGLSIVASIMREHNGKVWINRNFGDSRFCLSFPSAVEGQNG